VLLAGDSSNIGSYTVYIYTVLATLGIRYRKEERGGSYMKNKGVVGRRKGVVGRRKGVVGRRKGVLGRRRDY